jgi:DNA-binding MarR family transcriptional regulator
MHPATMTGVLDRLERGGWIATRPITVRSSYVSYVAGRKATEDLGAERS